MLETEYGGELPLTIPVYNHDELYKLGWVSGFYGCLINLAAASDLSTAQRSLFAAGYDEGLSEREQRSWKQSSCRINRTEMSALKDTEWIPIPVTNIRAA